MLTFITEHLFIPYIIIASVITFALYGIDKAKAKAHKWRIPEKVLLGMCFIGGAFGGWLGMYVFHHKTKHWYFYAVQFISALMWVILFCIAKNL